MKSFVQAVDYVNLNQETWDRMIKLCYNEWESNHDHRKFDEYALSEYGIKIDPLSYNSYNYHVTDSKKYMMFQIKFS